MYFGICAQKCIQAAMQKEMELKRKYVEQTVDYFCSEPTEPPRGFFFYFKPVS